MDWVLRVNLRHELDSSHAHKNPLNPKVDNTVHIYEEEHHKKVQLQDN